MITNYAAHFTLMGDSPTGGLIASNPPKGDECGQVFAEGRTSGWGFGDPESPVGAVALGGPVGEPAQIVGAIFKRGEKTIQPPLDRGELCPGDMLCKVRIAVDQDEHETRRAAGFFTQHQCCHGG